MYILFEGTNRPMKTINSYDYEAFLSNIITGVKNDIGLTVIPDFSKNIPEFPYTTYAIINPHIDIGYSQYLHEQFDIVMSLTTHSNSVVESLNTSSKLLNWFKDEEVQENLLGLGINVFQIFNQTQINNPFPIDVDRRTLFEVRLRVENVVQSDNSPEIENIVANGTIDVKKKGN